MMTKARIIAAGLVNAWKSYDDASKKFRACMTIRIETVPQKEASTRKINAYVTHAFTGEGNDQHEPILVIETERRPYETFEPRIRLTEAEAVDLGRFIRVHFGE